MLKVVVHIEEVTAHTMVTGPTPLTTITGLQIMALAKQIHGLESHLLISDITALVGIK